MVKFIKTFIFFLLLSFFQISFANAQKEAYSNDILYSEEYFDYLIECAQIEKEEQLKNDDNFGEVELDVDYNYDDEIIISNENIFKLHVQKEVNIQPYSESFKRENTKTIIPVSSKFSFFQDTLQTRNKYNSNDYKVIAGAEYNLHKFLNFQGGFETNYRGFDQNPQSRKLYITPQLNLTNKFAIAFPNKINVNTHTSDHDIQLKLNPFKSGLVDFSIYASMSRKQNITTSKSLKFTTSFYF